MIIRYIGGSSLANRDGGGSRLSKRDMGGSILDSRDLGGSKWSGEQSTKGITLNGLVDNDGGTALNCGFDWGLTSSYGNITPTTLQNTGQTFSQTITGLIPGTTYHFRATANNGSVTVYGNDLTFIVNHLYMDMGGSKLASREIGGSKGQ